MVEVEELVKTDINVDLGLNLSPIYKEDASNDVLIILFKVNYPNFVGAKAYNQKVCGKTCLEYLQKVCGGFKTIETEVESIDDPVFFAKSLVQKEYKYTALLFTDTPLLTSSTFLGALDYARLKKVNMLRLYRGFIFSTDYLLSISNLYLKEPIDFEPQDFVVCKDYKSLHEITNLMQNRIYNYHFENSVKIIGNPIIDADAFIGKGTILVGNNQILKSSQIGENSIVVNSIINNSIVGENANITNAFIEESILKNNVKVLSFASISNKSIVENNAVVKSGLILNNQKLEK